LRIGRTLRDSGNAAARRERAGRREWARFEIEPSRLGSFSDRQEHRAGLPGSSRCRMPPASAIAKQRLQHKRQPCAVINLVPRARRVYMTLRFAMSVAARLNPAQRAAVEHGDGPLLVLAGAGSGKTRVITHRIVRLLERGVPAAAVVALTFTNKAAGEMRERVAKMLGKKYASGARALTVSTFHSFGLGVLQREREAIGGTFTIFDQGDQTSLVKQLLRAAGADRAYDAQAVIARISNAKNAFLEAGNLVSLVCPSGSRPAFGRTSSLVCPSGSRPAFGRTSEREGDAYDEIAKVIYPRYQAALRQYKAFDFDDLVCEVARLWREHESVRARWQKKYLHVLVDEYQDTNRAQLEMLRLLCGERRNVCAVGDDDQAIYGWRGADVRNILDFEAHFDGARVVKLEQNYRSRTPILSVANAVIAKRTDSKWRKVLFTEREGGDKVRLAVAPTPEVEATWIGRELRRLLRDEGRRARDVAVLYRSNGQSRLIEEALREQGIAHRVVGGTQFFERKEVKDVLAYVKVALNPSDEISLRRVVNYPARGIGEATLEKLALHAARRQWTLWQAVERVDALDDVPGPAREGCRALAQLMADARRDLLGVKKPPSEVARAIVEGVGLKSEIDTGSPSVDAAGKRWANVEGVLATLARREAREGKTTDRLSAFLHALTMDVESEGEDAGDVVTLSTLHGSKGLEFDVVFLVGCEEGYLPHARTLDVRATDDPTAGAANIEEERRLFYVGVTRAREQLFISRAKSRVLRGKAVPRTPSRFLLDVPAELLEEVEVKEEPPTTTREAAANVEAILAMLK
jgi:DNA helicase-2/ATP-dependent DNA helicase PcrA